MAFLSTAFLGSHTVAVPRKVAINKAVIGDAQFDTVFATTDTTPLSASFPAQWSESILMWATFDESLAGGSIDFVTSDVMAVAIRRREKGTGAWTEVYRKRIEAGAIEDFKFVLYDVSARAGVTYEYAFVPILVGSEGAMAVQEVKCEFKGLWIYGASVHYHTDLNVRVKIERNFSGNEVTTLGRRYPYYVSYGQSNYDSGSISGVFAPYDEGQCKYILPASTLWRERLIDFLSDRKPKVIKTWDGRLWVAGITPSVSQEDGVAPVTSISFIQIAASDDMTSLSAYGFIKEE